MSNEESWIEVDADEVEDWILDKESSPFPDKVVENWNNIWKEIATATSASREDIDVKYIERRARFWEEELNGHPLTPFELRIDVREDGKINIGQRQQCQ